MRKFWLKLKVRISIWLSYRRTKKRYAAWVRKHRGATVPIATGETLDRWGEMLGNRRMPGETDNDYRKRLYSRLIGK